jgi:hypothetical protein
MSCETVHEDKYTSAYTFPKKLQAYENKTAHRMDKTVDVEPVCVRVRERVCVCVCVRVRESVCACVCVCVLRILITKDKILSFPNCNVRIYSSLKNS